PSFEVPEVIIKAKGGMSGWSNHKNIGENSLLMYSKFTGVLGEFTFDQNNSLLYDAIENTKVGQSVSAAERFLFLELPGSFVGGELLSAGWRAAGLSKIICGPLGRLTTGLIKICFTEGTLVVAENGNIKIEDIKEGDLVWSYNEETGKKELKRVIALSRNTSSSLVRISVNDTEISCTPEHPFYVSRSWIEAKDLTKGMPLTTLDGKISPVESITFLDEKVKVYNFEVEGNHNYYVSEKGILVHNNCEWANAITNTLENSASRMTSHLSEHFFAGEFNIGGRPLSQMFQKGLSYKDVLEEAAMRIGRGEGTFGTSAQGVKEIILDYGRVINQSGTSTQVRIWMNEAGTSIRSLHPYLGR
ncbi:Hint domain-containing protein, partial [Chryseobacterium rhizosphaerae]